MVQLLQFHPESGRIYHGSRVFDPWLLSWTAAATPTCCQSISPTAALGRLAAAGRLRRVPVGIIGPRQATADECATAERLGSALARSGLQLLCGGGKGVMEAACKGALAAGGQPIGVLPDNEWTAANPHVAIPIATGLGAARNAIIGRACLALVAVGGGYGTLSEIAFGLQFERLVLTLGAAPTVAGAIACADVDEAVARVAAHLLGLS